MIGRTPIFVMVLASALVLAASGFAHAEPAADVAAARQLRDQQRWAASESLATRALGELEHTKAPDSLAMADALEFISTARWKLAGYADGSGLAAAARSLGIRERRLGPDHLDVASAHALVSRFLQGTGRGDSALVHVRRALDIRMHRLAAADTLIAVTWDQLALVQRDRREMRGALDAWNQAIEIRKHSDGPESPEVARLLAQTGVPLMELGDFDRARAALERSLAMFARTAGLDAPGRWIPLNILADLEGRNGDMARDLDLLQEALRIVRLNYGDNAREAMSIRNNLAVALSNLGDEEGARAILLPLIPQMEAQYGLSSPRTLQARLGLALNARSLGDTATATRQLNALVAFADAHGGQPAWLLSAALGQQAEILYWQRRDREALALNARALAAELSQRDLNPDNLAMNEQVRIQILEAMGDTAALDSLWRDLKALQPKYFTHGSIPQVSIGYWGAHVARRLGRRDEAWTEALDAERNSRERVRRNMRSLPDRRALLLTTREDEFLDMVLDLARDRNQDHLRIAWDRLIRSRGMVRAEIARRSPPAALASDTTVAGALRRRIEAQRRLAQVTASSAGRDSAARARIEAARAVADDAEQAYALLLAEHGTSLDSIEAGLEQVRARLEPGQALVGCYEVGTLTDRIRRATTPGGLVLAFVARAGHDPIEIVEFGSTGELYTALSPWLDRLEASPGPAARAGGAAERECRRHGRAVRALTFDRLAPHLAGVTDVYLVPDGPLVDLPWQALPDGANRYLVENGPRIHLLNAERELVEPAARATSGSLLAVGAPDFESNGSPAAATVAALVRSAPDPCAGAAASRFDPLPGSGLEADAVGKVWRGTPSHDAMVLTGAGATEAAFKRLASGRAILHLATHGVVAGDTCHVGSEGARGIGAAEPVVMNASAPGHATHPAGPRFRTLSPWTPRRVWIALAGANHAREHTADENEGLLTAEEVLTLDLAGTDWVVLSACHSGEADRWSHEGELGMRRAFDLAGARTVIASQWAVDDDATREWMEALYAARAHGAPVAAAAMERASRDILATRRKAGRSTHPFYWAAFSATGE
jgi:CHAT domain/Tetratricopeptide repeat